MKTTWDLTHLYKNENDPQIEKDIQTVEQAHEAFEKKYRNKTDYLKDEKKLLKVLQEREKMSEDLSRCNPLHFLHLKHDIESQNQELEGMMNKISDRLTKSGNKMLFFGLAIGNIDQKTQKKFLKSPVLKKYHYFLKVVFDHGKHRLTEPEERILNLKRLPSSALWVRGGEKILTKQTINWKNKEIPISEAQNILSGLDTKDRRKLQLLISDKLYEISDYHENELNAVIINKKINDELKKYPKPYSATVLGYENTDAEVESLVNTITKHFPIAHRFYNVKKKMLKLDHLEYEDRAAKVGSIGGDVGYEDAYKVVREAFQSVDQKYADMLDRFSNNGQIDVYPRKGKRGGAYCSSGENIPTYVLLNHVPNFNSVMTLAHEMGHGFHAELSKSQPIIYQGHTISVAEVASTFFEGLVFDRVFEKLSGKEKVIALHDKIQDDIQTIFRQIACFNFELEMHNQIREKGSLSKEELAALMNKHMHAYLGPAFKMKEKDGYLFVTWMHLRYFFYVYSYAYGQIISKALYARYKQDPSYIKEIEKFLSAGGSKSPEDIFKEIGIDTSKPEFFVQGLKKIEEDIKELEKLVK